MAWVAVALMYLASCSIHGPVCICCEGDCQTVYGDHMKDIKKMFGDDVKDGSTRAYVATKVSTDQKGEEDLSGWRSKYKMTFATAKEKRGRWVIKICLC